jgi:hypothetical protein
LCLVERGALGIARDLRARFRVPAAGAPPPGSPPRWVPVGPSAVVSAAHEPGRVGCRLWGVGAACWCHKWPVPLSRQSPAARDAGAGRRRQRACAPLLLSRPLPASQERATALCFSLLSTARPAPGVGGEACVRTTELKPNRRAAARHGLKQDHGFNQ